MSDIRLALQEFGGDVVVVGGDIDRDDGLQTAVILSLFTDRRCTPDDLPAEETDLRGWWGDVVPAVAGDQTGSLLWLLRREKQLASVVSKARDYAQQALQWMIDDKVASKVVVEAEIVRQGWLGIGVTITRPRGAQVSFRYDYAWQAQQSGG